MKIAFVGKGGSGKSTITSLFIQYLLKNNKTLLAVDADINMHVSGLLGIESDSSRALSEPNNVSRIREHLKGTNQKIKKTSYFVKTTPPGTGSNLIKLNDKDYILKNFSKKFEENAYYMCVGTYDIDEIGIACYHTNLAILENVISHFLLGKHEWLVTDMVAGTDAFSNTLHAQFDAIILVVEPTPESISVFEQYMLLAKEAEIDNNLFVIGNKIEDKTDLEYLKGKIGNKLLGGFPLKKDIKKSRQRDIPLSLSTLSAKEIALLRIIFESIEKKGVDISKKQKMLKDLHRKYVKQDYIINKYGDITDQIDNKFEFPQK
jgi:CO dehydrogenase maturation factor